MTRRDAAEHELDRYSKEINRLIHRAEEVREAQITHHGFVAAALGKIVEDLVVVKKQVDSAILLLHGNDEDSLTDKQKRTREAMREAGEMLERLRKGQVKPPEAK